MNRPTLAGWTGFPLVLALTVAACGGGEPATDSSEADAEVPAPEAPASAAPASAALLNPNTADEAALAAVPGMTPEAVAAILAGRPYADMLAVDAALAEVLDEAGREGVYGSVFIPLDLNAAPEAELLLIPGVGDRMAYELDEYRPYDAIERFRREIGKYVDEAEVARLERYLVIR